MSALTPYDYLMILIVVASAIHGAWRGVSWQIAPIASLILGYMFAVPLSQVTAHWFGNPPTNRLIALAVMYIFVSLAVYLLVRSVRESMERLKLQEFDRHLGGLLGAVKGLLLTLAITLTLLSVSPQARDVILKSESKTVAAQLVHTIYPILPDDVHRVLDPYLAQLNQEVPGIIDTTNGDSSTLGTPSNGLRLSPNALARRRSSRKEIWAPGTGPADEIRDEDTRQSQRMDRGRERGSDAPLRLDSMEPGGELPPLPNDIDPPRRRTTSGDRPERARF